MRLYGNVLKGRSASANAPKDVLAEGNGSRSSITYGTDGVGSSSVDLRNEFPVSRSPARKPIYLLAGDDCDCLFEGPAN